MSHCVFAAVVLFELFVSVISASAYWIWWPNVEQLTAKITPEILNCHDEGVIPHYTVEQAVSPQNHASHCRIPDVASIGRSLGVTAHWRATADVPEYNRSALRRHNLLQLQNLEDGSRVSWRYAQNYRHQQAAEPSSLHSGTQL